MPSTCHFRRLEQRVLEEMSSAVVGNVDKGFIEHHSVLLSETVALFIHASMTPFSTEKSAATTTNGSRAAPGHVFRARLLFCSCELN